MRRNLLGLVLAGGASSRMGQNKALLRPFGQTLLERSVKILRELAPRCLVSCAPGHAYAGYDCIEDELSGIGPAAGLSAGLRKARELGCGGVIALACDLPAMTSAVLARLLAASQKAPPNTLAALYVSQATGRIEMLAGIYDAEFLPLLEAGIQSGERSLFQMLPGDRRHLIQFGEDEARYFVNCNTPTDLAKLLNEARSS